jgi:hypothetical protein
MMGVRQRTSESMEVPGGMVTIVLKKVRGHNNLKEAGRVVEKKFK